MSDLISRQAAMDVAKQHWYKPDIAKALKELPSAEPERKKGEWIKVMEGNAYRDKCNQCGRLYPNAYGYNFCPNCGADMRVKKKDLWINLADLEEVIGTYGIRRDVRANAAIKNLAVEGQIFRWTLVKDDAPENDNEVLVCVNMRTEDGLQMGAIEKASFFRDGVGWILHNHLNAEFDVVKWSPLPR